MYQRIIFLCFTVALFFVLWTSKTKNNNDNISKERVSLSQDHIFEPSVRPNMLRPKTPKTTSKRDYEVKKQESRPSSHTESMRIRFYVQNEDGTIPERGFIQSDDCEYHIRLKGLSEVDIYVQEECEFYAVRYDGLFQKYSDSVVIPYTPNGSIEQEFFFPNVRTGGFGIEIEEHEQGIRVLDVYSDSPAEEQALKYGDIIIEINGIPVGELTVEEFISNGTGPEGTSVSFRLLRDDPSSEPRTIVRRALTY